MLKKSYDIGDLSFDGKSNKFSKWSVSLIKKYNKTISNIPFVGQQLAMESEIDSSWLFWRRETRLSFEYPAGSGLNVEQEHAM
jgi:hypothetical protein